MQLKKSHAISTSLIPVQMWMWVELKPPQSWTLLASVGTSENPGQNPAHDLFSGLAFSEGQNCNNSDPETIESKGNKDTARRKVFGEHPLFPFFTIIKQITHFKLLQLTTLCYIGVRNRSILCEATGTLRLRQCWTFDSCIGLSIWLPSLTSATCSSPARLACHPFAALCYSPFPALWPHVSGSTSGTNKLRLTHSVLEQEKSCCPLLLRGARLQDPNSRPASQQHFPLTSAEMLLPCVWKRQTGDVHLKSQASACLFIFIILAQTHDGKQGYTSVIGRDINR